MENSKESVKKCCYTDTFNSSQQTNSSKTNHFKHNQCPTVKSNTEEKSINHKTYVIRKSVLCPVVDGKCSSSSFYGNDNKPFFRKQPLVKCEIESEPKSSAVISSKVHSAKAREGESELDLNGNLSFQGNIASRDFCRFDYPASKSSYCEKTVNRQSFKFNELPRTKCTKYNRQKTVFFEKRSLCPKNVNNSLCHPFTSNKVLPSVITSSDALRNCTKDTSLEVKPLVHHVKTSLSISKENFESSTIEQAKVDNQGKIDNAKCSAISDALTLSKDSAGLSDAPKSKHESLDKEFCKADDDDEFRIVKRQRKRLPKRWDQASAASTLEINGQIFNHSEKMLFPALPTSHHSQQEKLDSSRTCSMPPSEHSSAENSDLESVHSLPIGGAVNYSAPCITTSATSTIPQASYADVIRMSAPVAGIVLSEQEFSTSECDKNALHDKGETILAQDGLRKEDSSIQPGSSEWVISRLSQLDQNSNNPLNTNSVLTHPNQNEQNFVASRPIVVSLEKPSFYNSSLQINKNTITNVPPNLPSPDKKTVDNHSLAIDCSCNLEKMPVPKLHEKLSFFSGSAHSPSILSELSYTTAVASLKTDSVYSSPSSISSSICDAFKLADNSSLKTQALTKVSDPPVIIMNNCMPPKNMSEISFGIEHEEMVKLCAADSLAGLGSNSSHLTEHDSSDSCFSEKTLETDDCTMKPGKADRPIVSDSNKGNDIETEDQNHYNGSMISVGRKTLYWKDTEVDSRRSNLVQLTGYFSHLWKEVEKDYNIGSSTSSGKVKYFHEL